MAVFKPQNDLLVRQEVSCEHNASFRFTRESLCGGVCLLLCLQDVLPKALLRWMVRRFVLCEMPETIKVAFWSFDGTVALTLAASMTCEDLAQMIKRDRLDASMALDTFLVHMSIGTNRQRLLFMGARANNCIAGPGRAKGWGVFEYWTAQRLTDEELEWLNRRTVREAGVQDGDAIDIRYAYVIDALMEGRMLPI